MRSDELPSDVSTIKRWQFLVAYAEAWLHLSNDEVVTQIKGRAGETSNIRCSLSLSLYLFLCEIRCEPVKFTRLSLLSSLLSGLMRGNCWFCVLIYAGTVGAADNIVVYNFAVTSFIIVTLISHNNVVFLCEQRFVNKRLLFDEYISEGYENIEALEFHIVVDEVQVQSSAFRLFVFCACLLNFRSLSLALKNCILTIAGVHLGKMCITENYCSVCDIRSPLKVKQYREGFVFDFGIKIIQMSAKKTELTFLKDLRGNDIARELGPQELVLETRSRIKLRWAD